MTDEAPKRVPFPSFEPMGPPCPVEGCKGVLWQHISTQVDMSWKQCTACHAKVDEGPTSQKLDKAIEIIEKAFENTEY